MSTPQPDRPSKKGKKVRVAMRRNRNKPPRVSDWTRKARDAEDNDIDTSAREMVIAKGDLSRRRTIIVPEGELKHEEFLSGVVVSVHGLHLQVDDGARTVLCAVPRMLRTRMIEERHPVAVGDRVRFSLEKSMDGGEVTGVVQSVEPRRGQLQRQSDDRVHTVVANVDQAIIVSSADEPPPKPNLIDRYIVSALAGGITPVICMNKIDLDGDAFAARILARYATLGYAAFATSTRTGEGIDRLRTALKDKSSAVAGQSGVGKSSLLNAVQPGLGLKVGEVTRDTQKGRHTTTTATLVRLEFGGFVVDTPGIRAFELAQIDPRELEAYFIEFVPLVAKCKFPDCLHTHETGCAVKAAVDRGEIHSARYESYVRLFEEGCDNKRYATR